jgi:hypothetical protein
MKKTLILLALLAILRPVSLLAQEDYPSGTPIGRIFADYKFSLDKDQKFSGFDVKRAWLGYKYSFDEHFSAQIIVDIGEPISTDDFSVKRYAHFRNALLAYKSGGLTISGGILDIPGASIENKLWGKRYLARPFMLQYKFASIADVGIVIDYKISDFISLDAAVLNGEGYTKIESDNSQLFTFGATFYPVKGLLLRAYADTYRREDVSRNTFSTTAGYQHEKFSLAFGYNYKTAFDWTEGNNSGGFTTFGSVNVSPKIDLFGRYDKITSTIPDGETDPWNYSKDGSLIICGIQYKYVKNIKLSINYQGWNPDDRATEGWDYLQLNAEFRF